MIKDVKAFNSESNYSNYKFASSLLPVKMLLSAVQDGDVEKLRTKDDMVNLLKQHHIVTEDEPSAAQEWVENIYKTFPNARIDILEFIADILYHQGKSCESVIHLLFSSGYCYYFALILKGAFGGTICWHKGISHIVWTDSDEITSESVFYDIGGVYYDYKDGGIVPVEELGQDLKNFLHVSRPR